MVFAFGYFSARGTFPKTIVVSFLFVVVKIIRLADELTLGYPSF